MKKIKNLVIGGIESKLFNLILLTAVLLVLAFTGAAYYQGRVLQNLMKETSARQKESMTEITYGIMADVVDYNMGQATVMQAGNINGLFHSLQVRVEMLGDYANKLLAAPGEAVPREYQGPDPANDGVISAQLLLADGVSPEAVSEKAGIIANMSDMMISLFGASEETNSCFVALPEGAILVVDDRPSSKFTEDGKLKSFDPRTRPWYEQAAEEGKLIFTDVEYDAFTGEIGIVCAMPIYVDGTLEAVVGSDFFLSSMQESVQSSEKNGGFIFVVNQYGHVVFSPKTEGPFKVTDSSSAVDLRDSGNEEFSGLINEALEKETGVKLIGDYYMAGAPMKTVGWAMISAFDKVLLDQPSELLRENYEQVEKEAVTVYREGYKKLRRHVFVLLLVLIILFCLNAIVLGKRIVKPLNTITKRISGLSESNLEFKMEDAYRTGDEIEVLAESFARVSHRTIEYMGQVQKVTAEKERIHTELQLANQIQESMLPNIFPAFPERDEFDVYATMDPAREVGGDFYDFFLIDKDHLCMIVADVSGKGIPAAMFMMISKIVLQSCAMLGRSVSEILTKTNEALCSNNRMEMFVTVWIGILEISTGKLSASNAGHEYPAIKQDEKYVLVKNRHGFVVGGMEGMTYKEETIWLHPGDKLFLYTDGVAEASNDKEELFGTKRMIDALNADPETNVTDTVIRVRNAVDDFVGNAEQFDDLTMLCLEYKGPGGEPDGSGCDYPDGRL